MQLLRAVGRSSSLPSTGSTSSLLFHKFIALFFFFFFFLTWQQHERMGEEGEKNLNANFLPPPAFRYMFQKWFVPVQILFFIPFY